jgi:two-component system sensor histidine kinase GlrK
MPSLRPKALSSLLALSFALLALPLLLAVGYGALQLRDLSRDSDRLVRQSVETTRLAQGMFRDITAMERSASLYVVLGDPRVAEAFETSRDSLDGTLSALESRAGDTGLTVASDRVRSAVAAIDAELAAQDVPAAERVARVQDDFTTLWTLAGELTTASERLTDTRLTELETRSERSQRWLFWSLTALVPAAVLLAAVFVGFVLRPLRQIDTAISELGRGTLTRPIVVRGPTDLEALGRQLEWLRRRLLELAEEKNRFLRHMSHELKTPLSNIREGTDLLVDGAVGPLDSSQREVAGILQENALKLQRLIENLLSFSARQSQSMRLDLSDFQLPSLVGTVLDAQKLALAARDIRLDIEVEDIRLQADRSKLKLVLDNLLSNALKFTPAGGTIHIHGHVEQETAVIDFADSGPGIPEEDRARVFEAFFTGGAPQSGPLKGTGIGLSVVQEFVQAHGGNVELGRGRFAGAHFRIRLPLSSLRAEGSSRRPHAA